MDGSFGGVIGVFFDRQAGGSGTNLLLEQIPQGIYSGAVGNSVLSEISLKGWLDTLKTDKHWTYDGSLTTPPCSEGIKWTVLADVQPISQVQLDKFKALWEVTGNNRKVQPLNARTLNQSGQIAVANDKEDAYLGATIGLAVVLGIVVLFIIFLVAIIVLKPELFKVQKQ